MMGWMPRCPGCDMGTESCVCEAIPEDEKLTESRRDPFVFSPEYLAWLAEVDAARASRLTEILDERRIA